MAHIKGITITLYEVTQTGVDAFNHPIVTETPVAIKNVLVMPLSETEMLETANFTGKKVIYQLGIPKSDAHDWTNKKVSFFGQTFKTVGAPQQGINDLIPLEWNKKVRCEVYNG